MGLVDHRAKSIEEYRKIINDILDELDDLRASIEYDEEFMGGSVNLIPPLEEGVKAVLSEINSGRYEFGKNDLTFIDAAYNAGTLFLPFRHLFQRLEATHKNGLLE